jgi:uncharacterized protein (DUF2141 family)
MDLSRFLSVAAALLASAVTVGGQAAERPFTLTVTENQSPESMLYVAVFAAELDNWQQAPSYQFKQSLPAEPNVTLALNLPPGRYAIRAYIDLDNNGTLNRSTPQDRPLEPFASSVSPGHKGAAMGFKDSIIELNSKQPTATLRLRYPKGTKPRH